MDTTQQRGLSDPAELRVDVAPVLLRPARAATHRGIRGGPRFVRQDHPAQRDDGVLDGLGTGWIVGGFLTLFAVFGLAVDHLT